MIVIVMGMVIVAFMRISRFDTLIIHLTAMGLVYMILVCWDFRSEGALGDCGQNDLVIVGLAECSLRQNGRC